MSNPSLKQNIKNIVIAGAGTMGSSLAQIFSQYRYDVTLYTKTQKHFERSRQLIALNQATAVSAGSLTKTQSDELISRIAYSCDTSCFASADFILENITENLDIKQEFWALISKVAPKNILLASNTSGLSLTQIAKSVSHPERFGGMHWVNPPHLIPLVEIIRAQLTSTETCTALQSLALSLERKPVLLQKDSPGFILNRIQLAVLREAMYIVESGIASMSDVDNVLKYGLGMRYACIGPFESADFGGLDIFYQIASYLLPELCSDTEVSPMLASRVQEGRLGVKTKSGFYDYPGDEAALAIAKRDASFLKLAKCLFEEDTAK